MRVRLVHLEDDPGDRVLVALTLRAEGIDCAVVEVDCRDEFERALDDPPDIILSDCSIPGFAGDEAQDLAQTRCPGVPFVFVSGSIGEERAVERLKKGATDYVLKDRLDRLAPAVKRALRKADEHRRRAAAEAELRHLNTQLEARVIERTRELVAANQELQRARQEAERANRAKSEFLSRMSHDLRTPLNAIVGFAQLMNLDELAADQADSLDHILRGGEHLRSLINEALDSARIESGRLTLPSEGVPVVEAIDHALDGTGLGLALSRRLASEMNGRLTVEGQVDHGTVFHVRMPLADGDVAQEVAPANPAMIRTNFAGSVLYIEDHASNVVLMKRLLARRPNVRLRHAPDGRTGLEMLKAERPSLVILDLHLADMPGEEVLRRIWSNRETCTVPVAVLSADATGSSQRRLRAAGAIAYLAKPFDVVEMLRLIDEVVGGGKASQA